MLVQEYRITDSVPQHLDTQIWTKSPRTPDSGPIHPYNSGSRSLSRINLPATSTAAAANPNPATRCVSCETSTCPTGICRPAGSFPAGSGSAPARSATWRIPMSAKAEAPSQRSAVRRLHRPLSSRGDPSDRFVSMKYHPSMRSCVPLETRTSRDCESFHTSTRPHQSVGSGPVRVTQTIAYCLFESRLLTAGCRSASLVLDCTYTVYVCL